jgi:hypothetical protein
LFSRACARARRAVVAGRDDPGVGRCVSGEPIGRWSPPTTKRAWPSSSRTSPQSSIASRAGEQNAFEIDDVLHHYQRAAREL